MHFTGRPSALAFARASTAFVLIAAASASAFAQTTPVPIPGQTREEIDPASRTPAVQARLLDPRAIAQAQACPFAGRGRVTLSRIAVTGATLLSQQEIDAALADLTGRESDLEVFCTARDRVVGLYADRGEALVRVDLPEQRVSGGVLTLNVSEGQVATTTLKNPEALGAAAAQAGAYLSALKTGVATRWADVERAFLLIREIPGAEPGFSIRRADEAGPAAVNASVAFAPRRMFDFSFNGQNFGSAELGRAGGSLRVDANSFTSLGERTSFVISGAASGNQRVFQLLEEMRLGASGLTLLGDIAYGESEPGGALESLLIEGRSIVGRLGARYPLVRRRAHAIDVGARFEFINQENALGFLKPIGGDDITLFDEELRVVAGELNSRWQPSRLPGFFATANLELRKGLIGFGASKRDDPLLSREDARPDFTSLRLSAAARHALPASGDAIPWVSAALSGQWAPHGLPAYEEFQIGNYSVGRGYDPGAASGDRALGVQLEGGVDFASTARSSLFGGPQSIGLFAFFDAAKLWNMDPLSYDSNISSLGGGLRLRGPSTQFSLFYAAPQSEPLPTAGKPKGRMLVTFTRSLSIR